jgi:hypothetical protein
LINRETLNFHAKQATADAKIITEDTIRDICISAIKALKSDNFDRGVRLAQGVLSRLKDFNKGCPQLAGKLLVDKIDRELFFRGAALERLIGADDNASRQIARSAALSEMVAEFDALHLGADRMMPVKKEPEKVVEVQDSVKLVELRDKALKEGDYIMHTSWELGDDASKSRVPEPAPGCPKCLGAGDELSDFLDETTKPTRPLHIDSFKALSGLYRPERFGITQVDMGGFKDGRKFKK